MEVDGPAILGATRPRGLQDAFFQLRLLFDEGVSGLSLTDTRQYLQRVADQRLVDLGMKPRFGAANPFGFMQLQNVQELANFFERTVSAYQVGITGDVAFDEDF